MKPATNTGILITAGIRQTAPPTIFNHPRMEMLRGRREASPGAAVAANACRVDVRLNSTSHQTPSRNGTAYTATMIPRNVAAVVGAFGIGGNGITLIITLN